MSFYASYPVSGGGGGVPIYANLAAFPAAASLPAGSLAVAADTGILYEDSGSAWVAIAGPGAALGIGTINSGTPNANGAQIISNNLVLQLATASVPGYVSTGTQTFAGAKTFTGAISASNLSGTNTGDVTLGTASGLSLSGQILSLALSSTSTTGALSSTDWNTFNGKQDAGNYITALTGDATASGPGSAALTLATVNGAPGSFGDAASSLSATVNAKGLVTSLAAQAIQIAESQVTNLVSDLAGKQPIGNYITALTGDATASGPGSAALTLATVNASPGSFGDAAHSLAATVNAKGLITALSANSIQIAESQVTNLVTDLAAKITNPMTTSGDTIYGGASGAPTRLAGSTSATLAVLTQTGNGSISAAPVWTTSTGTGSVVLSISPTFTGTIGAAALTLSTALAIGSGGTGQTTQTAAFDALSPTTTKGDLIASNGTNNVRLGVGSNSFVLTADSTQATGIKWAAAPGSTSIPVASKTTTYTATTSDGLILCSASAFTVTLPAASNTGQVLRIQKTDSTVANIITVAAGGGDTIQGAASVKLVTQYDEIELVADGANTWCITAHTYSSAWNTFTMVITGSSSNPTKGTTTTDAARWRREGDSIRVNWTYLQTGAGSAGSGDYIFNIPNSATWAINTTVAPLSTGSAGINQVGFGSALDPNVDSYMNEGYVAPYSTVGVGLWVQGGGTGNATNALTKVSNTFKSLSTTTIRYQMEFLVPITGWLG